jgi:hypothetical protein
LNGSFDSAFSADSSSSWELVSSGLSTPTSSIPTRRESCGSLDLEDMSSSQTSIASSNSPPHQDFYSMASMNHGMLNGMEDSTILYATPNGKSIMNHGLMTYDFKHANTMYSSFEQQDYLGESPTLMFDHNSYSPVSMTPSPSAQQSFMDPTQMYLEPFQPATPVRSNNMNPRSILGSSPSFMYGPSPSSGALEYFMSPDKSPCRSAQSSRSFSSMSSASPCAQMLESSAALHRVQGSGIRKQQRKPQSFGNRSLQIVSAGAFRCDVPGCESKHAFKRQEHLKRHKKTHLKLKTLQCRYCPKTFQEDRSDNYRSHVVLHSKKDQKGSRTPYFAEALEEVESWKKERSRSTGLAPAAVIARGGIRRNAARLAGASF